MTTAIREALRKAKKITGKDREFGKLVNLNLTESQRKDASNYEEGQVVIFHQTFQDSQGV